MAGVVEASVSLAAGGLTAVVVSVLGFGKPHPCLPAWSCAPTPEQMPVGLAQHPLAQSASVVHCPPINCSPFAFPTFFAPAGSKGG